MRMTGDLVLLRFWDGQEATKDVLVPRDSTVRLGEHQVVMDADRVILWSAMWKLNGRDQKPPFEEEA